MKREKGKQDKKGENGAWLHLALIHQLYRQSI